MSAVLLLTLVVSSGLIAWQAVRAEREAQRAAGFIALVADDDGHELELAEHALEEGELIFESVLGLVASGRVSQPREPDELAHGGELGG